MYINFTPAFGRSHGSRGSGVWRVSTRVGRPSECIVLACLLAIVTARHGARDSMDASDLSIFVRNPPWNILARGGTASSRCLRPPPRSGTGTPFEGSGEPTKLYMTIFEPRARQNGTPSRAWTVACPADADSFSCHVRPDVASCALRPFDV